MQPLNVLYIHGFGSRIDMNSDKHLALQTLGQLSAFAPDYTRGYLIVIKDVKRYLDGADLLIGTSMGGYLVSRLSEETKKPFIAINPVIDVANTLGKHVGAYKDHFGRPFRLTKEAVDSYPEFQPSTSAMVLLDMADDVIDSNVTLSTLGQTMVIHPFQGGTHRFSHMKEALPLISMFISQIVNVKNPNKK
jgi:uncharacterized protein